MTTYGVPVARTAHHVPAAHSRDADDHRPGSPWRSVVLYDLRYSARSLTDAARESRRPRPRAVRRKVDFRSFARHGHDRCVAQWSALEERRARQRLRTQLGNVLRLVNTAAGELALDAAEAVDVPPARHRRGSLWLA
ncbi:hypothetical protein [Streptomyces sp. NPDC001480]|uniref:hypothetical protein n=1 Tax=Streptomyces sp. NPDC001480 TaxID=3364577 RepID=UPI0036B545AD